VNNPNIRASNLITFFRAYPIRTPTKKPPPRVAAVGMKLSTMLIFQIHLLRSLVVVMQRLFSYLCSTAAFLFIVTMLNINIHTLD
jgi:hypothetical protein